MTTIHELETTHPPASIEDVSPRTRGLALFIQEAATPLRNAPQEHAASGDDDHDSLLFLGHWQDSHSWLLFQDPILEPVDKVVWAVIRHQADASDAAAFPSYEEIARLANIGSKATVSRAIMILRITRWLSLCARARDDKGRFQGNVYAVHDEPVSVGDAMYLDPEYIQFLHDMRTHHHDRVKKVAKAVLTTIEDAIEAGTDITQATTLHQQHEQHLAALRSVENPDEPEDFSGVFGQPLKAMDIADENQERVSSQRLDTSDRVQNLNTDTQVQKLNLGDRNRVQNLNAVSEIEQKQPDSIRVQNLNTVPVCSSSFFIKTTTTNTAEAGKPTDAPQRESVGDALQFPSRFSTDERALARMYLGRIPFEQHQDVLDELQGRLGNAGQGGPPIRNPIGYLAQLCNAVKTDAFQLTSFGLQVRQARAQSVALAKTQTAEDRRQRQVLLVQPLPPSPLADKLTAIRQQAHNRQHGPKPSVATFQETQR